MQVRRAEVAQRIHDAKEMVGAQNTPEYEDARNEQAFVEGRILQLELMLRNARVIDNHDAPADQVIVGSKVKLKDLGSGEEIAYMIVGSAEADPDHDKISNESPVGKALLGRHKGETVEVIVPAGRLRYSVLQINQ